MGVVVVVRHTTGVVVQGWRLVHGDALCKAEALRTVALCARWRFVQGGWSLGCYSGLAEDTSVDEIKMRRDEDGMK